MSKVYLWLWIQSCLVCGKVFECYRRTPNALDKECCGSWCRKDVIEIDDDCIVIEEEQDDLYGGKRLRDYGN